MKRLGTLLLGISLLAACNQDSQKGPLDEPQPAQRQANVRERLAPLEQNVAKGDSTGSFGLFLVPGQPRTSDRLQVQATGCTGALSFSWDVNSSPVPGQSSPSLASTFFAKGDIVTVRGECDGSSLEISRTIENTPPVVQSAEFIGPAFGTGIPLEVRVSANDKDGDELRYSYRWRVNGEVVESPTGALLPGEFVTKGESILLTVVPMDDDGAGEPKIGQSFVVPNSPPKFVSKPPAAFQAEIYTYQPLVEDPDGDLLIFSLAAGPPGMTIDPVTGSISWPISTQTGSFQVSIVATDQDGMEVRQDYTINLN